MSKKSEKHDHVSEMAPLDRLSTLISRFQLSVQPDSDGEAALVVVGYAETGLPERVLLLSTFDRNRVQKQGQVILFWAGVDWGGPLNPLFSALPDEVVLDVRTDVDAAALVQVLQSEYAAKRCGADSVLNRLGEVLIVRLLRAQMERGGAKPGVLGGLADHRLSRAIVAIHNDPGQAWTIETLADHAGLSRSRFTELFTSCVGETPSSYIRRWRMTLARQDIERGERVQTVAHRYGYGSSEAMSRAFRRQFGQNPLQMRSLAVQRTPSTSVWSNNRPL